MSSPAFAAQFGRLLSQRIREPDNVDAHNVTLGELTAANSEPVTLTWVDWHVRAGSELFPPTSEEMLPLLSRMAAHGIRELTFDAHTERAHLLGAIWILTRDPVVGDGGTAALAQFRLLGAATVHAVSVIQAAADGAEAVSVPAALRRPSPFVITPKSLMDQLTDSLDPVEVPSASATPAAPRGITTTADRPPQDYQPLRFQREETVESLIARFAAATTSDDLARSLDALATYTELRPKKLDDISAILLTLIAGELRVSSADAKRTFSIVMKRIGRNTVLRGLAGAMATQPDKRGDYMRIFAYFGEPAAEQIVEQLVTAESSKERRVLFDALVELKRGVPSLIYMLSDGRWYVVRNAAELLGELRAVEAEQRLVWLLTHADARVRRSAAVALAKLQTPTAREALKTSLMDESPDVRLAVTHALAAGKDKSSVAQVLRALADEKDADIQRTLLLALGKIGTPEAIEHLIQIAEPESRIFKKKPTWFRVAAVVALAESNSSVALAAVRRFVNDREAEVRAAATKSLTPARGSPGITDHDRW
ncbi:MAG: HEAT repeat domain-containing protein [bacterium]